jgi:hypothetical protein
MVLSANAFLVLSAVHEVTSDAIAVTMPAGRGRRRRVATKAKQRIEVPRDPRACSNDHSPFQAIAMSGRINRNNWSRSSGVAHTHPQRDEIRKETRRIDN